MTRRYLNAVHLRQTREIGCPSAALARSWAARACAFLRASLEISDVHEKQMHASYSRSVEKALGSSEEEGVVQQRANYMPKSMLL